jgi:ComF family protein
LRPQSADLCARCGEDLGIAEFSPSGAIRDQLCRPCELVPPDFDKAVAFGVYEGVLRGLIHLLKYDRIESVAQGLSELLAPYVVAMLRDAASEVLVVPVPLHPGKRRDRGFNQAELLARGVIASVRKVAPAIELTLAAGMLSRKRATESQSTLTTRQRRRNLRGAFFVSEQGGLDGREVLLIDDIYTTGATARACGKALRDAGAARVWVATVGRAQRDGAVRWDAAGFGVPTGFAAA